jgi:dynein heavy chain
VSGTESEIHGSDFKPLAEWKRERTLFELIRNIAFFKHNIIGCAFRRWHRAKRQAVFRRVRASIAARHFAAKPLFLSALQDVSAAAHTISNINIVASTPHTYHRLEDYADSQTAQRETRAKPELEAVLDGIESRIQTLCRTVAKQARLYQESVRCLAELQDTTGVELATGASSTRARPMVTIKGEKLERARTYLRIMQEESLLGNFVRLTDYMCSEALMVRAVESVADVYAQLHAPRSSEGEQVVRAVFVAFVDFADVGMSFSPTEAAVQETLNHSIVDGAPHPNVHAMLVCRRVRVSLSHHNVKRSIRPNFKPLGVSSPTDGC